MGYENRQTLGHEIMWDIYYLYKKEDYLSVCGQGSGLYQHTIYNKEKSLQMEWTPMYEPFNGEIIGITEAGIKEFKHNEFKGNKLANWFSKWARELLMTEYEIEKKIEEFYGQGQLKL